MTLDKVSNRDNFVVGDSLKGYSKVRVSQVAKDIFGKEETLPSYEVFELESSY